ncbi:MAG: DNA primase [Solitalea-like symbiont of Tyrophagus putrescentiae]
MIEQKGIDEVLSKADIVEVVSEFIDIKRQGANYIGLSPFTNEKTPSFVISPSKQIFKDFSSGKGGDVITFLIEHEKITFVESVKWLAKYYNIALNITHEGHNDENLKKELIAINIYAKDFFKKNLFNPEGQKALLYFKERNINIETINNFDLGYAINSFNALTAAATNNDFDIKHLNILGLINKKQNENYYDKFRDRIIFPIYDLANQVIGFGGRILNNDDNLAKYINSNESIIYSKRNTLYGLNLAKQHIIKNDNCYLVEGYLDVLSMHQAGICNTVASSGTALTSEQVRLVSRFTKNITVLYDGDTAGINASLKAVDIILQQDKNPEIVQLPNNHDPNSYIQEYGPVNFKEYIISNQTDFIEYFINNIYLATNNVSQRAEKIADVLTTIAAIPSAVKRNLFIEKLAELSKLDYSTLSNELTNIFKLTSKKRKTGEVNLKADINKIHEQNKNIFSQEYELMRICLNYGNEQIVTEQNTTTAINIILDLIKDIKFKNKDYIQIINIIKENLNDSGFNIKSVIHNQDDNIRSIAADLLTERHKMSLRYIEKYKVTQEKDIILELVENITRQLKFKQVTEDLADIENKMMTAKTEVELLALQDDYNTLIIQKIELGKKLLRIF